MKDSIDALLGEYTTSESDRRSTIIETLSDSAEERVHSLFLNALCDKSEECCVRVAVLKAVPFQDYTFDFRKRFSDTISTILNDNGDDVLVRQYAALAMRTFVGVDGVLDLLESLVCNSQEDIDVRHNALSSIERNVKRSECQSALRRLVAIPELGPSADRTLQQVSKSS
ncbi:MAG: hypothetical protein U0894_12885 [Pirellulales bacterium]